MNCLEDIWQGLQTWKPNKIDKTIERDVSHGWLIQYLLPVEAMCWGRWNYWCEMEMNRDLLDKPIPPIKFGFNAIARKHLEKSLDIVTEYGSWRRWGSWRNMDYFLDWLLYGFGFAGQPELPKEPSVGASMRLYQYFNIAALIAYPHDYLGEILADNQHGRSLGFFPTPHTIVEMMVLMTMQGEDSRTKTVCDPCVGTGRMLLYASNYSLRLYGMDINETMVKVTLVNGYLYAPWLVKPMSFLKDDYQCPEKSAEVAEAIAQSAPRPDVQEYLANTEHDTEHQWKFEPIKKLKKKSGDRAEILQGTLF